MITPTQPRRRRRTATQGSRFLLTIAFFALWLPPTVLPRVRHELGGMLHGDAPTAGGPVTCRPGNVLASAHKGDHLALQERCVTAIGHVAFILHAPDGDIHISLLPDRGYWRLLDRHNLAFQGATLVVEVAPADRAGVTIPPIGAHVRVTGALVTDRAHGWREVHPTWQIVRVSS